ncbi:class I SAM-dependent RNA methyltransferase [Phreatobacter aquaticus]|uniref:Class I SAM-dependent RNA methyltransferase n=1 Tax=Phreatobacter aquaticus TaxID=2570229 RepID=A0A4D7QLW0_9HYPH|nr:class I SAM-dependent RNA methyltransferase [Phreatobacter aquaticus]QCK86386.1 class I SAM-dependent RNA methyltransferase [Phreatobacter aquaticus]
MTERLTISHVGHRGDGVADGRFVPFTLPGEVVDAEGAEDRLMPVAIVTPSPDRVTPPCPHFGICGGCNLQHWAPQPYLAWKRDLVLHALAQQGISADVLPTIEAHGAGRRRVTFHARRGAGTKVLVGFAAARSHAIIPINACPLLAPGLDGALEAARGIARILDSVGKPLDLSVTATIAGLDMDVRGAGKLSERMRLDLISAANKQGLARLTNHGELVMQREPPSIMVGRVRVTLPPGTFLQATEEGENVLARLVLEGVGKVKSVADLFCGVGPFALRLAESARVHAVDADASAVAALGAALRTVSGLKPVIAETRDLYRRPMMALDLKGMGAVVFDPPRGGAEAQAKILAKADIGRIVAVSCNPGTFARDAALLIAGGWKIESVTPVDQFQWSAHVELVATFKR